MLSFAQQQKSRRSLWPAPYQEYHSKVFGQSNGPGTAEVTPSAHPITRLNHDYSHVSAHFLEFPYSRQNINADEHEDIHINERNKGHKQAMNVLISPADHSCTCGGDCPKCKAKQSSQKRYDITKSAEGKQSSSAPVPSYHGPVSQDFSQVRAHKNNVMVGPDANKRISHVRDPRSNSFDRTAYRGPGESLTEQRGPGTGTSMGCVIGPMRVISSGTLEGGYSVNDYLSGGLSWSGVTGPNSAGPDGRGFKVQLCALYSNDTSLGVSQTMTHGGSNQNFLDGTASYLGKAPGSVTNGATFDEPVLNASDHYAHTGWELQYGAKTGTGSKSLLSFADVPRAGAGEKGYIDFHTCFYSRGGPCKEDKVCKTWRWTVDFTGTQNTNTVT